MYYCPLVETISAAVVEAILPTLKEMKTELNNLNELYNNLTATVSNLEETVSGLNETVRNLEETVNSHETQIAADLGQLHTKLTSVNDSMRKELKTMESALKEHMTSELVEVVYNLEIIDLKVELLDIKQERHESRMMLGQSQLEHNVLTNVTKELKKTHNYGPVISVNTTCREELKVIETLLEEHNNQTTSELADLNTSLLTFTDNHSINIVSDAVLHKVWPYLINIEDNLSERINDSTKILVGEYQDGFSSLNESLTDCIVNPSVNRTTPDQQVSKQLSDIQDGLSNLREKVCNVSDSQRAQDMNETINSHMKHLNSKLISLNYTVISSEYEQLEHLDVIDSKLDSVSDILRQEHSDIRYDIEEHKNHVNSELIELENNQDDIDTKLDSLDTKQDELNMQVMSVSSELQGTKNMLIELLINGTCLESPSDPSQPVTTPPPPVTYPAPPVTTTPQPVTKPSPSVTTPVTYSPSPVTTPSPPVTTPPSPGYTCGGTGEGGWRHVVYFDMRDPNTTCPTGWRLTPYSKRTCGKVSTSELAFSRVKILCL